MSITATTNPIESLQEQYGSDLAPQLTCDGIPEGRTGRIKALLMNPTFIAGIGNIYSDEILYAARIQAFS